MGYFGLDSRPRAPPAGQHGPCAEVREVAGLKFPRLHFGGFAPRAWRVSAGRLKKNRGFSGFSRRGGLAFRFCLLHSNLTTWGLPMNNEKNETANFAFSLIWVYLGVLSFFRAVSFCICPCVLASRECSRMGGPGPRSIVFLPAAVFVCTWRFLVAHLVRSC